MLRLLERSPNDWQHPPQQAAGTPDRGTAAPVAAVQGTGADVMSWGWEWGWEVRSRHATCDIDSC